MRLTAGLALALFLLPAAGAAAGADDEGGACRREAEMRCGAVEDPAERERCVVEREMECEREGPRRHQHPLEASSAFRGACHADFERLCKELGPEADRRSIVACLTEHQQDLSPDCRQALERVAPPPP